LGLDANLEGEEGDASNSYASGDKSNLSFPGLQSELLEKIISVGKPVIVVCLAGSAMDLSYAQEKASAVIQAWYPGAQGGRAIASLLFGEFSPSGRLPVTFSRDTDFLPEFTDYSMEGRTYRYFKGEPLYPFGYGLGYTVFEYKDFEIAKTWDGNGAITAKATVTNTGGIAGIETAQLYIGWQSPEERFIPAPAFSLKGFKAIELAPGESKTIEFELGAESFSLFDADGNQEVVPGTAAVHLGGSQPDARSVELVGRAPLKALVEVTGSVAIRKAKSS
jgi:beta-glucosidase